MSGRHVAVLLCDMSYPFRPGEGPPNKPEDAVRACPSKISSGLRSLHDLRQYAKLFGWRWYRTTVVHTLGWGGPKVIAFDVCPLCAILLGAELTVAGGENATQTAHDRAKEVVAEAEARGISHGIPFHADPIRRITWAP